MMLCAKFGWNWPSGSGEEDVNVKRLRRQRQQQQRQWQQRRQWGTTDKFWSEKLTWAFGPGELKKTQNILTWNCWVSVKIKTGCHEIKAKTATIFTYMCMFNQSEDFTLRVSTTIKIKESS